MKTNEFNHRDTETQRGTRGAVNHEKHEFYHGALAGGHHTNGHGWGDKDAAIP
jgi:hypothetical protein